MAKYAVSVKLRDAYQRTTVKQYEVEAADHAAAVTATNAMCADLAGLTMAEVLEHRVSLVTPYTDSVSAGANLDAGITLSVLLEDNTKAVLKIPAPVTSVVNSDGTVDILDALVTDYVNNWLAQGWYISDGETAVELLSGKLDK